MIEATQVDRDALLEFLANDVVNCLYLYLDIYHYGIGPDGVQVWYKRSAGGDNDSDPAYDLVVMKFGDSLQVYSPQDHFDAQGLFEFAQQVGAVRTHAKASTIQMLQPVFGDGYEAAFGQIFEKTKTRNLSTQHNLVEEIGLDDVAAASEVILSADEFAHSYSSDDMQRTLTSLIESGIGACYVIREDGRVAATEAITATSDLFMITSYLVTHPGYRNSLYGAIIESYISHVVKGDKRIFTMVTNPRRAKLLEMLGNPVVGQYGKLVQSGA